MAARTLFIFIFFMFSQHPGKFSHIPIGAQSYEGPCDGTECVLMTDETGFTRLVSAATVTLRHAYMHT